MLEYIDINSVLFLDIETAPMTPAYEDMDETFRQLWKYKSKSVLKKYDGEISDDEANTAFDRAGIYAEFGKIICISVGVVGVDKESGGPVLRLKSFIADDEAQLLMDFADLLNKRFNKPENQYMCGHNIKEFDIPFICRRMLIHQLALPKMLDLAGKKPWETKHLLDTMELWKFGDHKAYSSLKLLAALFGFPSPKDDIDGSEVAGVYWNDKDLPRIARYCEKDVLAVAQLLLKYMRRPLLTAEQIKIIGV